MKKKRQYDNLYPSVTEILSGLRKISLENWFKVTPIKEINEQSNRGKEIGNSIHEAIHAYIENSKVKVATQYAEEVKNALTSFMLFRKEHPEFALRNAEMALTSELHKFNGTLDCLGDGIIFDWKTANAKAKDKPDIYDDYLYQVSAYVNLYNEVNKATVGRAVILSLAKDKVAYNMRGMDSAEISLCFQEVFLPALRIWQYQHKKSEKLGIPNSSLLIKGE